jgi:hypothetical protein
VGDFRAPDGSTHAFAWDNGPAPPRAKLRNKLRGVVPASPPPVFVDLGVGRAGGIDDEGDIVGTLNGEAGWWIQTAKDQWLFRSAGFPGTLAAINFHRIAVGTEVDPLSNDSVPVITYGIGRRAIRLGFSAFARNVDVLIGGMSDGPVVGGLEIDPLNRTVGLIGMIPRARSSFKLIDADTLLGRSMRSRVRIAGIFDTSTGGLAGGSALVGGLLEGMLLVPRVIDKLYHATDDLLDEEGTYHDLELARLSAARGLLAEGRTHDACGVLTKVRHHFDDDAYNAESDSEYDFYDHIYWVVREAQEELGCRDLGVAVIDPSFVVQVTNPTVLYSVGGSYAHPPAGSGIMHSSLCPKVSSQPPQRGASGTLTVTRLSDNSQVSRQPVTLDMNGSAEPTVDINQYGEYRIDVTIAGTNPGSATTTFNVPSPPPYSSGDPNCRAPLG